MKTFEVHIPVLIKEQAEGDLKPKELAMSVHFQVKAETADQAAHIVWERLMPTCGDP